MSRGEFGRGECLESVGSNDEAQGKRWGRIKGAPQLLAFAFLLSFSLPSLFLGSARADNRLYPQQTLPRFLLSTLCLSAIHLLSASSLPSLFSLSLGFLYPAARYRPTQVVSLEPGVMPPHSARQWRLLCDSISAFGAHVSIVCSRSLPSLTPLLFDSSPSFLC